MYPRWTGEKVITEDRYESLIILVRMVWDFQRSLAGKLSNPDNEELFQAEIYENNNPETAKNVIAATHRPNCAIHKIST